MRRFKNMTIRKEIDEAIHLAEYLLDPGLSPMIKDIINKNDFQYDSGSGSDIVLRLTAPRREAEIFTYRPRWMFSKAIGYSFGDTINLNVYKIDSLSTHYLVGNLIHEWSHYCGFHHVDPGFWGRKRANYITENKLKYSVPYFLSENIKKWIA